MFALGKPLDDLLLKIERAKKHILDLEAERDSFFQTKPYRFRFESNPQTRERTYYLAEAKPIPRHFSLIIGDAINNLRSALDHVAYHLVCVGTGNVKSFPDAKFPIGGSSTEYRSQRDRAVKGMRQDAIEAIDALEPYKGGTGEYFWHLARLNNHDKHRLLVTAWSSFEGHSAFRSDREFLAKFHGGEAESYVGAFMAPTIRIFPLKAGDKLFTVPESEVDENMNFLLSIAFAEPEIVKGNPVLETLHEMTNLVRKVIFEFDRAGLF